MKFASWHGAIAFALLSAPALLLIGCGRGENRPAKGDGAEVDKEHDHSEWWCAEHGIPEHECTRCSKKVAAAYKAKDDWCAEHNRGKSQCFKCDPKLQEVFAQKYRDHYEGKEPPPITRP